MRILIAEDDLVSRKYLSKVLSAYGKCDLVIDGLEAIDAFMISLKDNTMYDLVCLDIMMPKVDGVKVLKTIRALEKQKGISPDRRCKIIMTTALGEIEIVQKAFEYECDAYAPKPIDIKKLIEVIKKLGLAD